MSFVGLLQIDCAEGILSVFCLSSSSCVEGKLMPLQTGCGTSHEQAILVFHLNFQVEWRMEEGELYFYIIFLLTKGGLVFCKTIAVSVNNLV